MHNQKSTSSRALAFWLGLTLHLALGATLYHQVTAQPNTAAKHQESNLPTNVPLAKP